MNNTYVSNIEKENIQKPELTYILTRASFKELTGDNFNPQKVIDAINDSYGLMGTVTELHIEG